MLSWIESETKETFDLKVNNSPLSVLKYLDIKFKLSDDKVSLFQARTAINGHEVTDWSDKETFEYQPGILTHKILDRVGEAPVTNIEFSSAAVETGVTNETIECFSQLNIPKSGLHTLSFWEWWPPLQELLSETVLDKFVSHCTDLKKLEFCWMKGTELPVPI